MSDQITAIRANFLGHAPGWYKFTILAFLVLNPILVFTAGPYVAGWVLIGEFIFTLAMALKCYPLQPGGLLALQAVFLNLTTPDMVKHEVELGLEVILLLIFMVAGIHFLREMLLYAFTKILTKVRSKLLLSLLFSLAGALLSAFLDALTVTAVVITIAEGFYSIYHKVASGKDSSAVHDSRSDDEIQQSRREDLESFRAFLRSLMMHAAVGTALGGVTTIVGEPQNIIIGDRAGWDFIEFLLRMSPVTMPVLLSGLLTVVMLEVTGWFGYGAKIPPSVLDILKDFEAEEDRKRTTREKVSIAFQLVVAIWLVVGLMFHLASVGLIGLSVIVLATAFTGVIDEHSIGKAFTEALPFTALLVVFFAVVAVINQQGLFDPVTGFVLSLDGAEQISALYIANGVLSAISDNVFVASVYISEAIKAYDADVITRDVFDLMAVAINTGTNIPSVATPNGQAAFLFLLTSAIAPLIRLSYMKMVVMALPYTIVMSLVGFLAVHYWLEPVTQHLYDAGLINHHVPHAESWAGDDKDKGGHH